MYSLLIIAILVLSSLFSFFIILQNPKGKANISLNKYFNAKKSKNILEKSTWIMASIIFVLSIISVSQINNIL